MKGKFERPSSGPWFNFFISPMNPETYQNFSVSIGLTGLITGVVSRDSNGSVDIQAGSISYDGSEIKQTFSFGQNSWNGFEFGKCEDSDILRPVSSALIQWNCSFGIKFGINTEVINRDSTLEKSNRRNSRYCIKNNL